MIARFRGELLCGTSLASMTATVLSRVPVTQRCHLIHVGRVDTNPEIVPAPSTMRELTIILTMI